MIHYIFDLDDTLIIHQKGVRLNYNTIVEDNILKSLLENCKGECYVYTNGTFGHAITVIKKMNIKEYFFKIYSRDNIPYMKPDLRSFDAVDNDIKKYYKDTNNIYFFDDLLENLKSAKDKGWTTFWINPKFISGHLYDYVDYSFRDIKTCLIYLEKQNNNNNIF
jgi:FMN phosphatase YigB (HAD superfamily)